MSKTDPMWVFENYGEAAELIDEHEAVIAQQATRIAELEKFADEANAQMLEAFAERDHALKAQQLSTGCDTCHGQGEIYSGEDQHFGYMSMQPPEPIMITCPECSGESVKPSAGVVLPDNLVSHRGSWIAALERLAVMEPEAAPGEVDDKAYWLHELQAMRDMYADLDRLNPCRAQAVADGYVVVPVEPTQAMFEAGRTSASGSYAEKLSMAGYWRAMLAAAPSAKKESE